METELSANVVMAYVIVALIQWAKKQQWIPLVDFDTARANRAIAALMAVVTSLGVHATYNGADGSLIVTGLSLGSIASFSGEALRQFIMQQLIYKGAGFEAKSEAETDTGSKAKGAAAAVVLIGSIVLCSYGSLT